MDRNLYYGDDLKFSDVALRKESVDRNVKIMSVSSGSNMSLSARRAWIEMDGVVSGAADYVGRSPQGERG